MNIRILHCGENLANYYTCIEKQIGGFTTLNPSADDMIYLCVKINGKSQIGARGVIDQKTNDKPWANSQGIKFSYTLKNIEYCKPFDISGLSKFGGSYWAAKYLQASKPIKDLEAGEFLYEEFRKNRIDRLVKF